MGSTKERETSRRQRGADGSRVSLVSVIRLLPKPCGRDRNCPASCVMPSSAPDLVGAPRWQRIKLAQVGVRSGKGDARRLRAAHVRMSGKGPDHDRAQRERQRERAARTPWRDQDRQACTRRIKVVQPAWLSRRSNGRTKGSGPTPACGGAPAGRGVSARFGTEAGGSPLAPAARHLSHALLSVQQLPPDASASISAGAWMVLRSSQAVTRAKPAYGLREGEICRR